MTATPYPLPRETRETQILVGNGTAGPYGPTAFKVFDVADVEVWSRLEGVEAFTKITATVVKTAGFELDTVSVTFPAPIAATTEFLVMARRTHERQTAVFKGGTLNVAELEKEMSKQASVLSELRRDVDRGGSAVPAKPGQMIVFDAEGRPIPGIYEGQIADAKSFAERAEAAAALAQAGAGAPVFSNRAVAAAYNPAVAPDFIVTAGYAASGDGGGAQYRKVGAEPSHAGKLQTSDGSWWEISEDVLAPEMLGAVGDWNGSAGTNNLTALTNLHGPARNTIYEENLFVNVTYGIFERGRGAIIRDNTFGPGVKYPVYHCHGGGIEFYDNVVDHLIFLTLAATGPEETSGFGGALQDAYAECLVVLGGNLVQSQSDTAIMVRDNIGHVRTNLVQAQTTSGVAVALDNLSVYDNDVEFYPSSPSDVTAVYGKFVGSSGSKVSLRGGRHGPNRLRTAATNTQPVLYGAGFTISSSAGIPIQFGPGRWSVRLADDTVTSIPVQQLGRDRLLVAVSVEESAGYYFMGWVRRENTEAIQINGALTEVFAAATTGTNGTDSRLQLHYGDGKLTIGNRMAGTRSVNVEIFSMG
ncbi:hypothetical protein [Aliihoeflea sp. 2WW]|uniref:hypothetical protein n=1 Tax=Aliihoeflea sp. 2WW TaxID=1381123 RepID=UPI000463D0ED|nr:hypothetical protein [Aliihoeflea sp. 2WW]